MRPLSAAALILVVGSLVPTSTAYAQAHSGYWVEGTPNRTESRVCTVVQDEEALRRELKAIRWGANSVPDVAWSKDVAVIVAPPRSHRGWSLTLFHIADPDTSPSLEWGWYLAPRSGSSTRSYGGVGDGPAAIVVAVPRDVAVRGLRCREVKAQ